MENHSAADSIKEKARQLGFHLVGICSAQEAPHYGFLCDWVSRGFAAGLDYIKSRLHCYRHPRVILPDVQSLIVLGISYRTVEPKEPAPGEGRISRYAWGKDYHRVIRRRAKPLLRYIQELWPHASVRLVVDTAPILERDFACLAGLGWIGKNCMLINPRLGSWIFLAIIATSIRLPPDRPFEKDYCGNCTRCMEACPTGAIVAPRVLDANRCIAYATIELRNGLAEPDLLRRFDNWIFGCDVCQEVCPWNKKAAVVGWQEFGALPENNPVKLSRILSLEEAEFERRFAGTPVKRAGYEALLRNAIVAMANNPPKDAEQIMEQLRRCSAEQIQKALGWARLRIAARSG